MSGPSPLTTFCNMLIRFLEELRDTFPEERDIKVGLETIQNARKINPRLILDMYMENVGRPLREHIATENIDGIVAYVRQTLSTKYNELLPALGIFDKHWPGLADSNRAAIWKYMKVLIVLADKAQSTRV
jgi:hypothetical protein